MKIFFNRVEKFHAWGGGSVFVTTMVNYLRRIFCVTHTTIQVEAP